MGVLLRDQTNSKLYYNWITELNMHVCQVIAYMKLKNCKPMSTSMSTSTKPRVRVRVRVQIPEYEYEYLILKFAEYEYEYEYKPWVRVRVQKTVLESVLEYEYVLEYYKSATYQVWSSSNI